MASVSWGEELTGLIAFGFEIYHDVPFDGFNIDHVLALEQAGRNTKTLSEWLSSATGDAVVVTPILTFPAWWVNRKVPPNPVHVLSPKKEIIAMCVTQGKAGAGLVSPCLLSAGAEVQAGDELIRAHNVVPGCFRRSKYYQRVHTCVWASRFGFGQESTGLRDLKWARMNSGTTCSVGLGIRKAKKG